MLSFFQMTKHLFQSSSSNNIFEDTILFSMRFFHLPEQRKIFSFILYFHAYSQRINLVNEPKTQYFQDLEEAEKEQEEKCF